MHETYRISDKLAGRQLVLSSFAILAVVAFGVCRSVLNGTGEDSQVFVIAVVVVIGAVVCWRNYKQAAAFAANHSFTLLSEAILIRDGASERKIPIAAIELLKVRRPPFGSVSFTLKVEGIPVETFYGYEHIDRLVSSLAGKLTSDRVQGHAGHA
jgi:hypothetical protein